MTGCKYCGDTYEVQSTGYRQISLNGHGLCRDCAKRFPDGCNGVTFESDLERYERMIMSKEVVHKIKRTDWLPSGGRVR